MIKKKVFDENTHLSFIASMNRIVISGANGFIGSQLSNYLYQKGEDVLALVRDGADISLLNPLIKKQTFDYKDMDALSAIIQGYTLFIHCAAQTKSKSFDEICKSNVDLTQKIVQVCNHTESISQFIFLSSQAAGGPGIANQSVSESDVPRPISWYGKSKLLAEKNVQRNCEKNWVIIRSASVYGPGDKDFLFYFQLIEKHIAIHPGLSDKFISLIYVEDLIKLIDKCILSENVNHEIINASDGRAYTINQFIETLSLAMNKLVVPIAVPDYLVSLSGVIAEMLGRLQKKLPVLNRQKASELTNKNWLCSNAKAVRLLAFSPQKKLLDNLIATYKWYKKHQWI